MNQPAKISSINIPEVSHVGPDVSYSLESLSRDNPDVTDDYRIAVMLAHRNGAPVQVRAVGRRCWVESAPRPSWDWRQLDYRLAPGKPVPVPVPVPVPPQVPLEHFDIPPVCWLRARALFPDQHKRRESNYPNYLVTGIYGEVLVTPNHYNRIGPDSHFSALSYRELFDKGWEYSSDRVNWKKCSKPGKIT